MSEPFNSGDEAQVGKRQTKAEKAIAQDRMRVRNAMSNPDARFLFCEFLGYTRMGLEPFVPGSPDVCAFNMGANAVGRKMTARLEEACPDLLAIARKEVNQKEDNSE